MFTNSPLTTKTEQLSQQVYEPIQVPIIIGNEVYIIVQNDVRNIIDARFMTCTKCPNGLKDLQDFVMQNSQNAQFHQEQVNFGALQTMPQAFVELINNAAAIVQCHCQQNLPNGPLQASAARIGPNHNIAPLQTQIDWEMKDCQAIKPDQFTYAKRTSTTDLRGCGCECNKPRPYNPHPILRVLISKGTNTTAAEIFDELERQKDEALDGTPPPSAQEVRKQQRQKAGFGGGIE